MVAKAGAPRPLKAGVREVAARWLPPLPAALFIVAFLVIPVTLLALTSLWRSAFFETQTEWNLQQYGDVLGDPAVIRSLSRSLMTGAITAAVTCAISFPVAYYLRFTEGTKRIVVLAILTTALFSSYLVRIYAWRSLLGREGAVNWALQALGIIDEPSLIFIYNRFAVVLTLTHIFIPFASLMILASLSRLDRDFLEAARTLGAGAIGTFARVTLPLCAPGLFAAFSFTFVLTCGDYVTPQLVGGTSGSMIGQQIANQFVQAGDYSEGAALSIVFLAAMALCLLAVHSGGRLLHRAYR